MPSSPVAERAGARRAAVLLIVSSALAAVGCGGGPPPRLYVLDAGLAGAGAVEPDTAPSPMVFEALGISAVTLPGYARDARVATRESERRIRIDDAHRWAEDPDEAITRAFAEGLRRHAGGIVLVEPWPRDFAPAARVEVDFDRLLRDPSGGVDAAGQIRLLSGDGRGVLDVQGFRIARAGTSSDPAAWFEAVAALVDELARTAVTALAEALGRPLPS